MSTGGLRILITNNTLGSRAGSELYVRDLAIGLLRRGHRPVVFSTVLGEVAELLRQATVPVVDDLNALTVAPDVIHGQHHLETMMAVQHFPHVPAVYVCHGWLPWEELPPVFPSIRRYVAVDDLCAERLYTTAGVESARVRTIYNGVDLERFQPRGSLPEQPRSALIFSNYAGMGSHSYEAIRSACLSYGIGHVDIAGVGSGQAANEPESLLGNYDVVFAKARCALEAMAVGCATVVTDYAGLGGMVSTSNVQAMRRLNFGMRTMQASPVTEAAVLAELERYAARDAAQVSDWIRRDAPFEAVVDSLLATYRETLDDRIDAPAYAASMAAASYLRLLSPRLKSVFDAEMRAHSENAECLVVKSQLEAVREREQAALTAHTAAETRADAADAECFALKSQLVEARERERAALTAHAAAETRADAANAECFALKSQLVEAREREQAVLTAHDAAETRADAASTECFALKSQLVEAREREQLALTAHAVMEREITDLQERLLASEREMSLSAATLNSLEQEKARMEAGLYVLGQDAAAFRIERDEAQRVLHEIYGSRAWRAVSAYRRLRAWLA